jgi:hypothetical protein
MNTSDESIQKQVEEGIAPLGLDSEAYKLVFNSVKKEPNYKLSTDFAYRISLLASPEKSFNWDKFLVIGGGIGFFIALIYVIVSASTIFTFGAFTFLSNYQGLLFFGVIFILTLNWLDKKLVPSRTEHV